MPRTPANSPVLTVAQAAEELHINPQRVRALIAAGRLKSTLLNPRMHLIQRADLEAVRVRKPGRPTR